MKNVQSAERRLSSRTLWAILVALLLGGLLFVIVAAEIGIRLLQTKKYGSAATVEQYYTVDKRIDLRVPIANLRTARIETNSLGFRGPEIRMPKPQGRCASPSSAPRLRGAPRSPETR